MTYLAFKKALEEFMKLHCVGKQYASCKTSPCEFASNKGCTHPLHPINREAK
jgi:hypothetical protein